MAPLKAPFTVILKHKEAAGAEVTVELDENLIGGGGHALLDRVAAELADLGRTLVGPVPELIGEGGSLKNAFWIRTSNNLESNEPYELV